MSTEHFVNRVNQGPFFDQLKPVEESEPIAEPKLDKVGPAPVFGIEPTVNEQPITDALTGQTLTRADWVEKWQKKPVESTTIEHRFDGSTIEEPNDNIGNGGLPPLTSLIVSRTEFERFKTQVIVAFKHLGLDTRRFFKD